MKISEIIMDKYKLQIPPTVYYDLLADVVEAEDEQEPKTGHWIRIASGSFIDDFRCDCCNNKPPMKQIAKRGTWGWDFTDFCPNCGADMRGEK